MPVGWEEVSTNDKKQIATAMNILQECYQFAPHTLGSDNLRLTNSAPELLAGEDMHGAETLNGQMARTTTTASQQRETVNGQLPPLPSRTRRDARVHEDHDQIGPHLVRRPGYP